MTRNQKIALGCGGAGCLGVIVVVIAAGFMYFFYQRSPSRNYNIYTNRNSNINTNDNDNSDSNTNDNTNSSSSSSSESSMSDDDKHKLYQAAFMTGDPELIRRVSVKIGLMDDDFTPGPNYQSFVTAHVTWALRNTDFVKSLDTPEKARAYVDQNFPD